MSKDAVKLNIAIEQALKGELPAPQVYLPPTINGRKTAVVVKHQKLDVREHIARIVTDADPIGFLIAVQNGMLFETHIVKPDGTVLTIFEQPEIKQRIAAARYLAERVLPRMSVIRHVIPDGEGGDGGKGSPERSWAQIVEAAASNDGSSPEGS